LSLDRLSADCQPTLEKVVAGVGTQPTLSAALAPRGMIVPVTCGNELPPSGYGFRPRCLRAISSLLFDSRGSIPIGLTSIRPHAANERSKIVLDRNPLQDIRNSESVHLVVPRPRRKNAQRNRRRTAAASFLVGTQALTPAMLPAFATATAKSVEASAEAEMLNAEC
jgi:hypothetical protein